MYCKLMSIPYPPLLPPKNVRLLNYKIRTSPFLIFFDTSKIERATAFLLNLLEHARLLGGDLKQPVQTNGSICKHIIVLKT